jgi:hypothetical protein
MASICPVGLIQHIRWRMWSATLKTGSCLVVGVTSRPSLTGLSVIACLQQVCRENRLMRVALMNEPWALIRTGGLHFSGDPRAEGVRGYSV